MITSPDVECVVVGAGVVGLACAVALAERGREVVVLEADTAIGQGISSRNSEVIHAGIYYPAGSAKARFCVEGRQRLYRFCETHGVGHRRCEKIIVAVNDQQRLALEQIRARAERNGVDDLRTLAEADLRVMEPNLTGIAGLLSPSTGILDSHAYMLALQGELEARGGVVAFRSPVLSGRGESGFTRLEVGGETPTSLTARQVVLAGGLAATKIARSIASIDPASIPETGFARGNYFSIARRAPFDRLIYPIPEPGGLGTHFTIDLGGMGRFGPDVEWLDTKDPDEVAFTVDPTRAERFYAAIRTYWPDLRDGELVPAYSGVRPKLAACGEPDRDFTIHGEAVHGAPGIVALYGIESPGLTSSLSIAAEVAALLP